MTCFHELYRLTPWHRRQHATLVHGMHFNATNLDHHITSYVPICLYRNKVKSVELSKRLRVF